MTLTPAQKAWATKLKRTLDSMPEGIELILGYSDIAILPAGFYERALSEKDMMTQGGQIISEGALLSIPIDPYRIRPNSESI